MSDDLHYRALDEVAYRTEIGELRAEVARLTAERHQVMLDLATTALRLDRLVEAVEQAAESFLALRAAAHEGSAG